MQSLAAELFSEILGDGRPVGGGVHLLGGQINLAPADVLAGQHPDLLVDGGGKRQAHLTVALLQRCAAVPSLVLEDGHVEAQVGIGVVVHVDPLGVGALLVPVKFDDMVLLPLMHVNRVLMHEHRRAEGIAFAEHLRLRRGDIHDHDVLALSRAQTDRFGRIILAGPVPARAFVLEHARVLQLRERPLGALGAELLVVLERQLKGGAGEVAHAEVEVVGINQPVLRRACEEVVGVRDDKLRQRRGRSDENGSTGRRTPSRAAGLLPCARNRARIPAQDSRVQVADVNA